MKYSALCLILTLAFFANIAADGSQEKSQKFDAPTDIRGEEHYAIRDGLRIYLWEKHKAGLG